MATTRNKIVIVCAAVLAFISLLGGCGKATPEDQVRDQLANHSGSTAGNAAGSTAGSGSQSAYVSPVDFELLHEQNPDICAWIDIPGTNISYPILQDEEDASFYLNHDSVREESSSGSLFMDEYNGSDFQDPLTVIYGHHMRSGAFFGELQSDYDSEPAFNEHRQIKLYLPEEERDYYVFAAVPYDSIHLLYNYDYSDVMDFYVFFDRAYQVRSLNAVVDEEAYPEFGNRILVLSTCLAGDGSQRFLVMAEEVIGDQE